MQNPHVIIKKKKGETKMTVQDITNLIGSLGFPIVACAALFWDRVTTSKELKKSVDSLTLAIEKLIEKGEN